MTRRDQPSDPAPLDPRAIERVIVDALSPTPDTRLIDRPDWAQQTTPTIDNPSANGVYLAKLSPEEADARIAEVKRAYLEQGLRFRWFVGPSSTPADLVDRLQRAGLTMLGVGLGMSMVVPAELPPLPPGLELREVGRADVELFSELSMHAWERDAEFSEWIASAATRALDRGDGAQRSWLVWESGQPVGVTTLRTIRGEPGIGYLQGAAVLPRRRRAGIYRAILHYRLEVLRGLGLEHAVIWAYEHTSARSCKAIGFETRCRGAFLEYRRAESRDGATRSA